MSIGQAQRNSFEERIKRIGTNAPNTMGEVHIGPRDEKTARKGKSTNTVRLKNKKKKVRVGEGSNLVLVPVAVIIGGLSVFAGKAAAFHFFQDGGLMPIEIPVVAIQPYIIYAHLLIAGLLALMFTWTFGLKGMMRKLAVAIGFGAMLFGEIQMIEKFPETYANFFSKDYVAAALKSRA
ncbi:MAG: hypothetical protein GKR98_13640 [Boseongicola sp.]|nr:MAG: hypothetical protein GKR98_13640 [Boseongicola sp.]